MMMPGSSSQEKCALRKNAAAHDGITPPLPLAYDPVHGGRGIVQELDASWRIAAQIIMMNQGIVTKAKLAGDRFHDIGKLRARRSPGQATQHAVRNSHGCRKAHRVRIVDLHRRTRRPTPTSSQRPSPG